MQPYRFAGNFRCIINHKEKWLCIATPKVACTSIKKSLADHLKLDLSNCQLNNPESYPFDWIRVDEIRPYSHYFRFGFVRHPIDRFIGVYYHKIARGDIDPNVVRPYNSYGIAGGMPLEQVVEALHKIHKEVLLENHLRPQAQFFYGPDLNCELQADYVGHFESLKEDWKLISQKLKIQTPLPHWNRRPQERPPWQKLLSQETKIKLFEIYKADFEKFGYTMD